ncbi:MAG TPA: 16S rRNA (guanine(966)-N(2))-methyltransferase RsmD [Thermomicrobiales bacterium]|nr:16S rRNA (guanine(966)-N(2))-methyltransferase RsmD [Thermomicrobiales bacterium]
MSFSGMRVISGTARGRQLKGPPSFATRPMTDKVKGALFNTLMSLGVEPDRVLDLYAGTGAIGIEALSRGASHATFVDKGREQCATIRANLAMTGFTDRADVRQVGVANFIQAAREPYDFIMLDPPYADPEIMAILGQIAESHLVQSGTIVVLGHSERVDAPETLGPLERIRFKRHGDSCFSIYETVTGASTDHADHERENAVEPDDTSEEES